VAETNGHAGLDTRPVAATPGADLPTGGSRAAPASCVCPACERGAGPQHCGGRHLGLFLSMRAPLRWHRPWAPSCCWDARWLPWCSIEEHRTVAPREPVRPALELDAVDRQRSPLRSLWWRHQAPYDRKAAPGGQQRVGATPLQGQGPGAVRSPRLNEGKARENAVGRAPRAVEGGSPLHQHRPSDLISVCHVSFHVRDRIHRTHHPDAHGAEPMLRHGPVDALQWILLQVVRPCD
jgi:hypothetical protein